MSSTELATSSYHRRADRQIRLMRKECLYLLDRDAVVDHCAKIFASIGFYNDQVTAFNGLAIAVRGRRLPNGELLLSLS